LEEPFVLPSPDFSDEDFSDLFLEEEERSFFELELELERFLECDEERSFFSPLVDEEEEEPFRFEDPSFLDPPSFLSLEDLDFRLFSFFFAMMSL
jgi:hypothetical protein